MHPMRARGVTGELFSGKPASELTLGDAFQVAFGMLARPTFMLPILVISIVFGAITEAAFLPAITALRDPSALASGRLLEQALGAFAALAAMGIITGLLASLYGQIWVVAASSGPLPNARSTFALAGRRAVGLLGTQLLVSLLAVTAIGILVALIVATRSPAALAVALLLMIPYVWFAARLSMASWLAADGGSFVGSLRGSWQITKGHVLRIVGWTIATAMVFGLLTSIIGSLLSVLPLVGSGIAQALDFGLTYGALVVLFRRIQAESMPSAVAIDAELEPEPEPEPITG
ncbi:MAG TPA: hypothetical protein VM451_00530 [Candidatus Limnocylindria bacterium]|nr:hypothetical protein [Candidatus Limnocylindria bacterium]